MSKLLLIFILNTGFGETSPKRKRGGKVAASLALRAGVDVTFPRMQYNFPRGFRLRVGFRLRKEILTSAGWPLIWITQFLSFRLFGQIEIQFQLFHAGGEHGHVFSEFGGVFEILENRQTALDFGTG